MKKYDPLWQSINKLLTMLERDVDRIDEYYLGKFGNDAPGLLLRSEMKKLQKFLDEAE